MNGFGVTLPVLCGFMREPQAHAAARDLTAWDVSLESKIARAHRQWYARVDERAGR